MSGPFTSLGKEVLKEGAHFADASDEHAAGLIAAAMNRQAVMLAEVVDMLMAYEPAPHRKDSSKNRALYSEGGEA
ncbi:hypothetical protein AB5I41_31300 [Sphingomonas sp. MMS24-JH45]